MIDSMNELFQCGVGGEGDDDVVVGRKLASEQNGAFRRIPNHRQFHDPRQEELPDAVAARAGFRPSLPTWRWQYRRVTIQLSNTNSKNAQKLAIE